MCAAGSSAIAFSGAKVAIVVGLFAVLTTPEPAVTALCAGRALAACGEVGGRFSLIVMLRAIVGVPLIIAWRRLTPVPVALIGRTAQRDGDPAKRSGALGVIGSPLVAWCAVCVLVQGLLPQSTFAREVYDSAEPMWLLWVAVLVAAPFFEELLFRGVLLDCIARWSRPLAAVLTALLWVAMHGQYSAFEAGVLFLLGLFLAWLRFAYGSLAAPVVAHSIWNFAALVVLLAG